MNVDNFQCPFCGVEVINDPALVNLVHPPSGSSCELAGYGFSRNQWSRRPDKKDAPAEMQSLAFVEHLKGEVSWLRVQFDALINAVVRSAAE